jgi:hypothetical protein
MWIPIKISATGKTALTTVSESNVGRLAVQIPAAVTINMTFAGRGRHADMTASDDVTLSYYTPASDTLAATAITGGVVYVKADGLHVFANVASVTGTPTIYVCPLDG